jgi:hypothetical protein
MFKLIARFLGVGETTGAPKLTRRQREIEAYLSQSVDRCDFERRENDLQRKGYFL